MNRHAPLLAVLGVAATLAMRAADADDEEEDLRPLQKVMRAQKKAMKAVGAAVQAKRKKGILENAKAIVETAKQVPENVPAEVTKEEDKKKFLEFAKALRERAEALSAAAAKDGGGDAWWEGVHSAFSDLGDSCQACHEVFAKEDDEEK